MSDPLGLLWYALAATGVVVLVIGGTLWWRSRQLDPAEVERRRRARLNQIGRIAEGRVVEYREDPQALKLQQRLLLYHYEVRGVEYESAQDVSFTGTSLDLQRLAAGLTASVKYDPRNPTNSIILAEDWSGI